MSFDEGQDQPGAEPSSLQDLPVDAAIRLRWVLRDIRAGRTKLLGPSRDDLRLLAQLGLISVDNDKLVLAFPEEQDRLVAPHKQKTPPERALAEAQMSRIWRRLRRHATPDGRPDLR